jgi:hypothetical protein
MLNKSNNLNKMELKVGLKFKKFYNENNINNIESCEVRGIVDDCIIVLWCKKKANKMSGKKEFYLSIDTHVFDFNVKNGVYIPL